MVRFPSTTLIVGVGTKVGSLTLPLTYSMESDGQQPHGILTIFVTVTLPYSSTAAGVKIARLDSIGSPPAAIARAIGPAVPPSGTAMLPENVTW